MSDPRDPWLAALGIERWVERVPGSLPEAAPPAVAQDRSPAGAGDALAAARAALRPAAPRRRASGPAVAVTAEPAPLAAAVGPCEGTAPRPATASPAGRPGDQQGVDPADDWARLEAAVAACERCALATTRTQTVFGNGARDAEWFILGEAPGADEDARGLPFVGRAGRLLDRMLSCIGLAREQVFVANILKCRPPANRDPRPEEVAHCAGHLAAQLALVQPRLVLALGRVAAQNLLGTELPVSRLRRVRHTHGPSGLPVVVTWHPAYLLRSPREKRGAWEDLLFARDLWRSLA